ncbi:MAG TPA: hypothetical protein VNT52_09735, partial [Acidimicrobiales bacterium]|nr:hypothetical protein [Acidimicrobiales bacterium]
TAALGDVDLGLDVEGLRRRFGDQLDVRVTAGLPGEVKTNAPAREGGRALWAPDLAQTVQLEASSEAFQIDPRLIIAAGGALLLASVLLVLLVRRRRSHRSVVAAR